MIYITCISCHRGQKQKVQAKKKKLWNQINQYHEYYFLNIFHKKIKFCFQKMTKMKNIQKHFREIDSFSFDFDLTSFLAWTFLNLLAHLCVHRQKKPKKRALLTCFADPIHVSVHFSFQFLFLLEKKEAGSTLHTIFFFGKFSKGIWGYVVVSNNN